MKLGPVQVSLDARATMPRRQSLFWDVKPETVDPEKHAQYVIERIMDFGTDEEARWMWRAYPRAALLKVSEQSRSLRPRTKALWHALAG